MKKNKLNVSKKNDPEWIIETVKELFNNDINNLLEIHRKILREQYLEYLKDGLQPKDAMKKALQIVLCFNQR